MRMSMEWKHGVKQQRMIRKMLGIVLEIAVILILGIIGNGLSVSAAGAAVSIQTKNTTVMVGDTVYVLITVKSSQELSGFEGHFPYDNRVLQFETGGSVVYGNDNEFRIEDVERDGTTTQIKYSIKFQARREGSTTITLQKPYNVFGESISERLSVSHNSLTIVVEKRDRADSTSTVKPQETATVTPSETPVPPTPSPAKKKKKKKKAKATVVPEETTAVAEKNQAVPQDGVRTFLSKDKVIVSGSFSIQVIEPEADQIPQGFGKTELELDGQTVSAYALESNTEHTYVLLYGKSGDQEQFYLYDQEKDILLPYDQVRAWYRSNTEGIVSEKESQAELKAKRLQYVVGILLAFIALMMLAVISLYMKYRGLDADELEAERNSEIEDYTQQSHQHKR